MSRFDPPPPPRVRKINPCLNLCDPDVWSICAPQIFMTYISLISGQVLINACDQSKLYVQIVVASE